MKKSRVAGASAIVTVLAAVTLLAGTVLTGCGANTSTGSNAAAVTTAAAIEKTQGRQTDSSVAAPENVQVLSQSVTSTGFTLVWNNPDQTDSIADYLVSIGDGSTTSQVFASDNSSVASSYIKSFYEKGIGDLTNNGAVVEQAYQILHHSYTFQDLKPDTTYSVEVQTKTASGTYSREVVLNQKTSATADAPSVLSVEQFGAVGDGQLADDTAGTPSAGTLNTSAIQKAIDACPDGGTVVIPAGKIYVTGPIQLKSNMTLEVDGTLLGSADASVYANDYDTDSSKTGQKSAPLVSTDSNGSFENIRITGTGTINGNGWCQVSQKETSVAFGDSFDQYESGKASTVAQVAKNHLAAAQTARYSAQGETKAYATRSNLIAMNHVTNLYIGDGLTITNPSMHTLGIADCSNAVVNNAAFSTYNCNNGDGIDYSSSMGGLTVVNSLFNTGDDCVCFAASSATTGNAWIFNNYFGRGHGVIALGSNTDCGIQSVTAEDNVANGTAVGLRGKSQSGNGGGAWNIIFRNTAMANITDNDGIAFMLTNNYSASTTSKSNGEPCFHDITITNCTVNGAKNAFISMAGTDNNADGTDYNITMSNVACAFNATYTKSADSNTSVLKNLKDSSFTNIRIYGVTKPWNRLEDTLSNVTTDR